MGMYIDLLLIDGQSEWDAFVASGFSSPWGDRIYLTGTIAIDTAPEHAQLVGVGSGTVLTLSGDVSAELKVSGRIRAPAAARFGAFRSKACRFLSSRSE